MTEAYKVKESKLIEESQQVEKLLLAACDSDTSALLRLADISILACGRPSQPTLTVSCKSREVTEAIGLRQAYIKTILKQITGCFVGNGCALQNSRRYSLLRYRRRSYTGKMVFMQSKRLRQNENSSTWLKADL